jgi:DNA-binding NarL/FixJ family response regulator
MSVRVLLADDHKIMCEGLQMLIEKQSDMEVVGVAHDGREAVRMTSEIAPDVVIMDVAMPKLNGIEAARQIISEIPEVKVIALSMHTDRRYVTGMLSAGVSGYLPKDCVGEELAQAIRTVVGGQVYLSPAIAGIVVEEFTAATKKRHSLLSPRELEVLQLLAEGQSSREIASSLHISVKTVETHRRQLMEKLKLKTVAELTKYAIREGITSIDR